MKAKNNNVLYILIIVLFACVIALPWILKLTGPDKTDGANEENTLIEKRDLAALPDGFSNEWFSGFEAYFNDHSPYRSGFISLDSEISGNYDAVYRNRINPVLTNLIIRQKPAQTPVGDPDSTGTPAPTVDMSVIIGFDTPAPTKGPTEEPTAEPTAEPSAEPTAAPTAGPTDIPTQIPDNTPDTTPGTGTATPPPTNTPAPEPTPTPHVHEYDAGRVARAATCTAEGERVFTCKYCGDTRTETIPVIDHNYGMIRSSAVSQDSYGYQVYKCAMCGNYKVENLVMKQLDNSPLAPQYSGSAIIGRRDWLFFIGDNSEKYFTGANPLSDGEMESWRLTFERLDEICKAKGISLVVMAAPNKEQLYPEYMPNTYKVTEPKRQDLFLSYMQANSSVRYLYPKNELIATKYFYNVFYKQDTHWNALGGFTGAMAVYRALGLPTLNLFDLETEAYTQNGGDLSNLSGGIRNDYPEYRINYRPGLLPAVNYYENHVTSSTSELSRWTTAGAVFADKKIVVLGDSFRHAMTAIFSKDFGTATIAHRTELGYNTPVVIDALKELGEGDVLLLMAVERYDGQLPDAALKLISILGGN